MLIVFRLQLWYGGEGIDEIHRIDCSLLLVLFRVVLETEFAQKPDPLQISFESFRPAPTTQKFKKIDLAFVARRRHPSTDRLR
jgi:hypothetical protein